MSHFLPKFDFDSKFWGWISYLTCVILTMNMWNLVIFNHARLWYQNFLFFKTVCPVFGPLIFVTGAIKRWQDSLIAMVMSLYFNVRRPWKLLRNQRFSLISNNVTMSCLKKPFHLCRIYLLMNLKLTVFNRINKTFDHWVHKPTWLPLLWALFLCDSWWSCSWGDLLYSISVQSAFNWPYGPDIGERELAVLHFSNAAHTLCGSKLFTIQWLSLVDYFLVRNPKAF